MGALIHIGFVIVPFLVLVLVAGVVIALLLRGARNSGPSGVSLHDSFFGVMPRAAKLIAAVLFSIAVTVGMVAVSLQFRYPPGHHAPFLGAIVGLCAGTFVGTLFAVWVLGLGYVYGDSRRRNMPAIPWTLLAAFVPNLLGFLLYFVLRRPIASPCPQCGHSMTPDQRFCPFCGYQRATFPPAGFPPPEPSAPVK